MYALKNIETTDIMLYFIAIPSIDNSEYPNFGNEKCNFWKLRSGGSVLEVVLLAWEFIIIIEKGKNRSMAFNG